MHVYISDLIQPIHNNDENQEFILGLLIQRMDKAFEVEPPPFSLPWNLRRFPRKIPPTPCSLGECDVCKNNMTVKVMLMVAKIVENFQKIQLHREACWNLLNEMYKLAKSVYQLKNFPLIGPLYELVNVESDAVLSTIVDASFSCFLRRKRANRDQVVLNKLKHNKYTKKYLGKHKKELKKYLDLMEEARRDLGHQMIVYILRCEERRVNEEKRNLIVRAEIDHEDVNAKDDKEIRKGKELEMNAKKEEEIRKAELEMNAMEEEEIGKGRALKTVTSLLSIEREKWIAVVILGDNGQRKTNIMGAVYDHLQIQLIFEDWNREMFVKDEKFNPKVQAFHSDIASTLEVGKQTKKLFGKISSSIQNEPVFLRIDNILRAHDLRRILMDMPKKCSKKVRLLVTSPNPNVDEALKDSGFECKAYNCSGSEQQASVSNPLLMKLKTDPESHPLFKEMKEVYQKRCRKEGVPEWMTIQDLVRTAFQFALEIAFMNLAATAQDALLDICYYFNLWNWDEVCFIVGKTELETLEENGWLKKNSENLVTRTKNLRDFRLPEKDKRLPERDKPIINTSELEKALATQEVCRKIKGIWLDDNNEPPVQIAAEKLDFMSETLRVLSLGNSTVIGKCKNSFQKLLFLKIRKSPPFDISNIQNMNYFRSYEDVKFSLPKMSPKLKVLKLRGDANFTDDNKWELKDLRILELEYFQNLLNWHHKALILTPLDRLIKLSIRSSNMTNIPDSLTQLYALQEMDLKDCKYLRELPKKFGKLLYLAKLHLDYCSSLCRLPESFGQLKSLKQLCLSHCILLKSLPNNFALLDTLKKVTFSHCQNLQNLPEKFHQLTALEELDLSYCSSLNLLPINFRLLSKLQLLNLQDCKNLKALPDNLPESLFKSEVVSIKLSALSSLTEVGEGLWQRKKIEDLSLANCKKLENLPRGIKELSQLKKLNLSGCKNLRELPKKFSELTCLETLNLGSCDRLWNLCGRFNQLMALKHLNVSKCPVLTGRWMKTFRKIKSLVLVDIRGSPGLEMQFKERIRYHFAVMTDKRPITDDIPEILEKAASKFFRDDPILRSVDGRPFFPSTMILPDRPLALVFNFNYSHWDWEKLAEELDEHLETLKGMQIISIVRSYPPNPTKFEKIPSLAYTPENSPALSFLEKPLLVTTDAEFWQFSTFIIETGLDSKGHNHFKPWKSMLGESRKLEMQEYYSDYDRIMTWIMPNQKNDPEEKMTFLVISTVEISPSQISILRDIYQEMSKTEFPTDWIWVPVVKDDMKPLFKSSSELLEREMPWLRRPGRLDKRPNLTKFLRENMGFSEMPILVSFNSSGQMNRSNEIPMLIRLGPKAWLFLNDQSYRVKKSKEFVPSQNNLYFLLQDTGIDIKAKKPKMTWLYGGDPHKISSFNKHLEKVSKKVGASGKPIQILYVGRRSFLQDIGSMEEKKCQHLENSLMSLPRLAYDKVKSFWHNIHYLQYCIAFHSERSEEESNRGELETLKKLVLAILSLDCLSRRNTSVWMMAFDENGDILTGRGKELVEHLSENIENSKRSWIVPAETKYALKVYSSYAKPEDEPLIELTDKSKFNKQDVHETFEDGIWLTTHPSSQLTAQTSDIDVCSLCSSKETAYDCDACECFILCKECYRDFIVGSTREGEKAAQINIESAQ